MSANAARLARLFTPEYAARINAQLVYPAQSVIVKPNELQSALARPLNVSIYEPHRNVAHLAATLSYGIIKGHPFLDGNKRTAFFLANEYARAQGLPSLVDGDTVSQELADKHISAASGGLDVQGLAEAMESKD